MQGLVMAARGVNRLCGVREGRPPLHVVVAPAPQVVGLHRGGDRPSADDVHRGGLHGGFAGGDGLPAPGAGFEDHGRLHRSSSLSTYRGVVFRPDEARPRHPSTGNRRGLGGAAQ